MRDETLSFESMVIHERAALDHDARCARGRGCRDRDWHIGNDYIGNARRARIAELEKHIAAARSVEKVPA